MEAARLDLARISRLVATFAASQSRAAALAAPAAPAAPAVAPAATSAAGRVARRPGPLRRFGLLLRRAWRQNVRDAWTNGLRLGVSLGLALVFGEIYGSVGAPSAASVAERVAVLSFGAINMAMMALMKTLDMLGRERHVVHRERSRGQLGSGLGLGLG